MFFQLYRSVSGYGSFVVKPLLYLGCIWIIGIAGMLGNLSDKTLINHLYALPEAMAWSFSNIFAIFGFRSLYFDAEFNDGLVPFLDVLAAGQTVFGFIFLFLLGLALRNHFRLR